MSASDRGKGIVKSTGGRRGPLTEGAYDKQKDVASKAIRKAKTFVTNTMQNQHNRRSSVKATPVSNAGNSAIVTSNVKSMRGYTRLNVKKSIDFLTVNPDKVKSNYNPNYQSTVETRSGHTVSNYATHRNPYAEIDKRKKQEEWRKTHTLEGQIETEIDKVTTTGKNTKLYNSSADTVNSYFTEYCNNVDPVLLKKWADDNIIEIKKFNPKTGKNEKVQTYKENALPPPVSVDSDGNTIDITKEWNYCRAYDTAIRKYITKQQNDIKYGRAIKYAGQGSDVDSMLDVVRATIDPNKSGSKAFKDYVRDYGINPLLNGDWKALGINTLWNLGETLDLFNVGVRASVASNDVIGGSKRTSIFDKQKVWWYSDSGYDQTQQRKLVALGADKLLRGSAQSGSTINTGGGKHKVNNLTKEQIESKIKEAGLWSDYKVMESAWKLHQRNFRDENKLLNNVKSAYTDTTSNFHANTGNVIKDIAIETALDPSLLIGGSVKTIVSSGTKASSEIAIKSALKSYCHGVPNKESQKIVNKAISQFINKTSKNLLTKSTDEIANNIRHLSTVLNEHGALDNEVKTLFEYDAKRNMFSHIDDLNYKVLRSLHGVDSLIDKVDTTLLKTVFAAPYVPVKAVSRGYHGIRNEMSRMINAGDLKFISNKLGDDLFIDELIAGAQYSKLVSTHRAIPKVINLSTFEETYSKIKEQPVEVWDELDQFVDQVRSLSDAMSRPLADFKDGKIGVAEYRNAVDDAISRESGTSLTRSELKDYLEKLFKDAPEADRGRVGKMYDTVMQQVRAVENAEANLVKRENDSLIKNIKNARTIDEIDFSIRTYYMRTEEQALSSDVYEFINAKFDELNKEIPSDVSDMFVRNYERSNNTTVDLKPRDAGVVLPASVSDNVRFDISVPEYLTSDVLKLRDAILSMNDSFETVRLKDYFYSVDKIEDMTPVMLHEVLSDAIVKLMLQQKLGNKYDQALLKQLQEIDSSLNNRSLSTILGNDMEFDAIKLDNLTVFDEYTRDPVMIKIFSTLRDTSTPVGKALKECRIKKLTSREYESNSEVYEILCSINDLVDMNQAYYNFRNSIDTEVLGLTDKQIYTVIDRIFGITKSSPNDYFNMALSQPEKFMQDLDNFFETVWGTSRCSLDGARQQVLDFNSDLYKDFKDEIEDENIRKRIDSVAQAGHINPVHDVRMQMFYTILRDPKVIDDYNNILAKDKQSIIFSDIETTGLNRDSAGITSIAFKEWKHIDKDNLTLDKILSVIEDDSTEKLYKRQLTYDEAVRLDSTFLNKMFAHNPKLANTDVSTKRAAYMEFYGESADGSSIVSSEGDLIKSINQYITDKGTVVTEKGTFRKYNVFSDGKVPILVFHNSNGFDINFITSKMRSLKVGIPKGAVKHLSDLEDCAQNTLARLRRIENDYALTYEQKKQVKEEVVKLAQYAAQHSDTFKFLDTRALDDAFARLDYALKGDVVQKSHVQSKDKTVNPNRVYGDNYSKKSLQVQLGLPNSDKFNDDILFALNSEDVLSLRKDLTECCKRVGHTRNKYSAYIAANPYKCLGSTVDSYSYSNIMRDAMKEAPDKYWSYLSYNKIFSRESSMRFFDIDDATKLSIDDFHGMKSFTDYVDNKIDYDLKAGSYSVVEKYELFYRAVIDAARQYAGQLSAFNKFSYLKFIKQPSTAMETYLMAQKLYDDIFKFTNNTADYNYYLATATDVSEFLKCSKKYANGAPVPEDFIRAQEVFLGVSDDAAIRELLDLENITESDATISAEAFSILAGDRHTQIFRSAVGTVTDYIDNFKTEKQQIISRFKRIQEQLALKRQSFNNSTSLYNISEIEKMKHIRIQNAYDEVSRLIDIFTNVDKSNEVDFWDMYIYFKKAVFDERSKLFDVYRMDRLLKGEDNLIAELMYSNGFRRVIPVAGDELHVKQFRQLKTLLDSVDRNLVSVSYEANDSYIVIQLNKAPILGKNKDGLPIGIFKSSTKEYISEPEMKLGWANFDTVIKKYGGNGSSNLDAVEALHACYDSIIKIYDEIDSLTNGASVGTLGILATHNKEVRLLKSFTSKTCKGSLGADFTCDDKLWKSSSFDKSLLGDYGNSWKLSNDVDDFDVFLNAINTLDEVSGRVKADDSYVDTFFGKDSPCKVKDLANDFSNEELLHIFNNSDDYVCVSLCATEQEFDGGTKLQRGLEVRQLKIKDAMDIERAKRNGSIYIPYDMFIELERTINNSEITSPVLKLWTRLMMVYKLGQLFNPGTWVRNWIDATYKSAVDEDSLVTALSYQFIAAKRLFDAQKIIRLVGEDVTEETWKANPLFEKYMTYAEFQELQGFKLSGVGGGDSFATRRMFDEFYKRKAKDKVLGIDGFNTIGPDTTRFEQAFSDDDVIKYCTDLFSSDLHVFDVLSKEKFKDIFRDRKLGVFNKLCEDEEWYYNKIANDIITLKVNKEAIKTERYDRIFNKVSGAMLSPMSQIELIVRYGQLMALQDMGLSTASSYRHIIDTHFNYNNKSFRMKCLEAVIPYSTFQYNNLLYWFRQIEQNPRMIRYLEHIFGELSFQGIDELVDDDGFVNQSLEYRLAAGSIPIGSGGMFFKLAPSYLDALNWAYLNPNDAVNKIVEPLRLPLRYSFVQSGIDQWNIFSETEFSHSASEWEYEILTSLPILDVTIGKYLRHFKDRQPWENVDGSIQKSLVKFMPDLFGATKKYNVNFNGDFDEYQLDLEGQGKWYDCNRDKVVDLKYKNEEGLNNPDLSFDERCILMYLEKGKLYDANVCHFVLEKDYKKGGLNRDWDFSSDADLIYYKGKKITQWDYFCILKKQYFGLSYDLNLRKFVKHLSPGGLNADNLDWDTICDLNADKGLCWDSNQNMFVKSKDMVIGGLNKKNLRFDEVCAYQLAIKGKVWDQSKRKFVRVCDPVVVFKNTTKYEDWKVFDNLGFDPSLINRDTITYMKEGMLKSISGKYVISDDIVSNQKIFDALYKKYAYSPYGRSMRKYNYKSGFAEGYRYNAVPIFNSKLYTNTIKSKGKVFGKAYTSTNDLSSLRMALSNYKSYDDYYKFEYSYNMSYRNPTPISRRTKQYNFMRGPGFGRNKFSLYMR